MPHPLIVTRLDMNPELALPRVGPPASSMSFLLKDVADAYGGIVLLTAFPTAPQPPFDVVARLEELVRDHSTQHEAWCDLVDRTAGFEGEFVRIAREHAAWGPGGIATNEDAILQASLWVGRLVTELEIFEHDMSDVVEGAAATAITHLINAFVASVYSFGDKKCDVAYAVRELVQGLEPFVCVHDACRRGVASGYRSWLQEELPAMIAGNVAVPEYAKWLRGQAW